MTDDKHPFAATCEEYESDQDDVTVQAVGRDTAHLKPDPTVNVVSGAPDTSSDSGYSSHTAPTVDSSQSSAPEPRKRAPPKDLKVDTGAGSNRRRPTLSSARRSPPRPPSPRKQSHGHATMEGATRMSRTRSHEACNCEECRARAIYGSRRSSSKTREANYHRYAATPHPQYYMPPPPAITNMYSPSPYMSEAPIPQAIPHHRPPTAPPRSGRPVSYHAGAMPEVVYMTPSPYNQPQDRGPPPAMSAYANGPFAPPAYPPPMPQYAPPPSPMPPMAPDYPPASPFPYADAHPDAYRLERPSSRRPRAISQYGPPVVEYDQPVYERAPPMGRRGSIRETPTVQVSHKYDRIEDFYRMPPPEAPRRPTIRHSATTSASAAKIPRAPSVGPSDTGAVIYPASSRSRREEMPPRRPSLKSSDPERRFSTYSNASASASIQVAASKSRRASYYGQSNSEMEQRQRAAEAYQNQVTQTVPLTVDALRAAERGNQPGSDSGSHRSKTSSSREGSDVKTRHSGSNGRSESGSLAMRFATGAGVTLDFSGDMDGRKISLRPTGDDGQVELSIRQASRHKPKYIDRDGSSLREVEYARPESPRKEIEDIIRRRSNTTRSHRSNSRVSYRRERD